jgi:hypothetical protein
MSRRRSKSFDDISNVDQKKVESDTSYNKISLTDSNGDFDDNKSNDRPIIGFKS